MLRSGLEGSDDDRDDLGAFDDDDASSDDDDEGDDDECGEGGAPTSMDVARRSAPVQQLYQAMDSTKELAETHYYNTRQSALSSTLIPLNEFWYGVTHSQMMIVESHPHI